MTEMTTPPFLRQGDTVGVIAPAYHAERHRWDVVLPLLHSWGFRVVEGKSLSLKDNLFSGSDAQRLEDLCAMMRNPDIKAVLCARGGYGTGRLLTELDNCIGSFGAKWLIGYSDISVLLTYWTQRLRQQCIHGPMPVNLQDTSPEQVQSWEYLRGILQGQMPVYSLPSSGYNRAGEAVATLTGGNLSVLHGLNGTPYQIWTDDHILFIEDVNENLYHLDRMMNSLRIGGQFHKLKGLLVGSMTGMKDGEPSFGKTACEIIREHVAKYDFPVVFDFPAGHGGANHPLVMGAITHFSVAETAVSIAQSCTGI
ncbi:MAG: LD-carboxypeptidase [Bacteroidales bacterium]|jgi:muramoyltetrapeptide carboxypeptidase|nr:LD-carboxypeptidase [Bacteroidales bacterium]